MSPSTTIPRPRLAPIIIITGGDHDDTSDRAAGDYAQGQRTRRDQPAMPGDFATGMRAAARPTAAGDFATGTRTSPTPARAGGDIAAGLRMQSVGVLCYHTPTSEPGSLPLAA
ncbi:MAG: hypothetical protein ABSH51_28270 [Solirubrobacteraceae bacterium]|jgi:hypothetical protein